MKHGVYSLQVYCKAMLGELLKERKFSQKREMARYIYLFEITAKILPGHYLSANVLRTEDGRARRTTLQSDVKCPTR